MTNSISKKFNFFTLLQFALPSMIMMVFMSLYTIIDGIFVSRYLGDNALSSINIVFPVINILTALGVMLATGGSAVIGKSLGEGKEEQARNEFTFFVITGIVFSIILSIIVIPLLRPVSYLLGSNDDLIQHCVAYLGTMLLFAPAGVLQMLFQSFFVTAGKPNIGLILTILGGIANIFLDYFFLGVLHMGIEGAALATGIGQSIPAIFGILYFAFVKKSLYFVKVKASWRALREACFNGSSEMVSNLSNAVTTYLYNIIMMQLVGPSGVAAITIILYGQFLFNSMYLGFSIGVAPVISFNYGAHKKEELQKINKICTTFVLLSSVIIASLSYFSANIVVGIFVPMNSYTFTLAATGFALFSFNYLFSGYNTFSSALFTALSDGKTSAIISFSRTFLCLVASLIFLPMLLGITGVWLAVPLAELITFFLASFFHKTKGKRRMG